MKGKTLLIVTVTGLLTFILGWFLHGAMRPIYQTKDTQMIQGFIDTVSHADTIKSNSFAHAVSGHFILTESNCAGLNFINNDIVLWTNEIACNDPDTLKIRWLSDSTFMTRSTLRIDKSCPPRVDIYKVVSFDRKHLTLKSIWTGWNEAKDENLELIKQPN
ncbi:hypothetical protein I5907_21400 [Panacibacter sp. DH6]|uniref:Uncharacterized protein n=1 Tax=Panacibacter microcysteis TaxID=2793269 RepID=A0A931MEA0_9BACT|nr:hypothetical protein [Panacibacter microcysteis]MBG9378800.1 hypothetical protein [Panacibacter microcysteis]MBG9378803.1 hypothetical protein [Panacibacter microcysteis]